MRLIDADILIIKSRVIAERKREEDDGLSVCLAEFLQDVLEGASIVDAEPVSHGKWIWKERHFGSANEICTGRVYDNILGVTTLTGQVSRDSRYVENVPYCSLCGKRNDGIHLNYCDYCGAKMQSEV